MTTEVHPRTYTCPKCGKVHAADLSVMEAHPEIHGKVHCMECHVMLWLSIGADGRTKCELFEAHVHEVLEAKAAKAEESKPGAASAASAAAGSVIASPSGIPTFLIAAVVAAVVSFLVTNATSTSAAPAADEPGTSAAGAEVAADMAGLEQQLQALQATLDTTASDARAEQERLAKAQADLTATVQGHTEALNTVPAAESKPDPALAAALMKIAADYKGLNGRIEANYTQLRMIKKRLENPDGK